MKKSIAGAALVLSLALAACGGATGNNAAATNETVVLNAEDEFAGDNGALGNDVLAPANIADAPSDNASGDPVANGH